MIKSRSVKVYEWFDIQDELCLIMGIPKDKFSDYNEVNSGEYKDLWHVCLKSIVPEQMNNETIVIMYRFDNCFTYFKGDESWKNKVLQAWNQFFESVENDYDKGVHVSFSW